MEIPITAKAALLQALRSGSGYGLELIERIRKATDGGIELEQGSVYPALRAMEREQLVTTTRSDSAPKRGGPPRKCYQLTSKGKRVATRQATILVQVFGLELAR